MEKIYDELHIRFKDLNTQSQNWTLEFEKVKLQQVKREEARQAYDHYDEKLEKLYKEREDRTKRNKTESSKEFEIVSRVFIFFNNQFRTK